MFFQQNDKHISDGDDWVNATWAIGSKTDATSTWLPDNCPESSRDTPRIHEYMFKSEYPFVSLDSWRRYFWIHFHPGFAFTK